MHALVNTAVKAARKAGDLIIRYRDRLDTVQIQQKGPNDLVTEIDQWAEQEIIGMIRKAYPSHGFLAEESGGTMPNDEFVWIIDPLDGTTNYVHGFPHYAVSIACVCRGRLEHAVIYDPCRQELFTASRGHGARLDNRRLRVSAARQLQGSLIATGFPFKQPHLMDNYLLLFKSIFSETAGVRRAGAASLDLAYVAAGRVDGFWELGLKPWDLAAGTLLIQEAGGIVTTFHDNPDVLFGNSIVAASPRLHPFLMEKIVPYRDILCPSR